MNINYMKGTFKRRTYCKNWLSDDKVEHPEKYFKKNRKYYEARKIKEGTTYYGLTKPDFDKFDDYNFITKLIKNIQNDLQGKTES